MAQDTNGMTARDAKLIQYLNEAYGKERELETALQAHIAMTTRPPYKKRLQEHLRETKRHAREVERRIKKLGGKAEVAPAPGPDAVAGAAGVVMSAANKAVAAAQGPLHMIRGTGEAEKMLKNAKTEFFNEAEEIATYRSIETLAESVGDKETAKLARAIIREEERMSKFLERLIPQLTKAVVTDEIPASERRRNGSARRKPASRSKAATRTTSKAKRAPAKPKRTSAKAGGTRTAAKSRKTAASRKRG
ncbi:MAG TPA: DUF892 family protein [Thermoleophilaceae bacterium]|nr:DUF892 family protein [Thermoleophilaceae bacterium]